MYIYRRILLLHKAIEKIGKIKVKKIIPNRIELPCIDNEIHIPHQALFLANHMGIFYNLVHCIPVHIQRIFSRQIQLYNYMHHPYLNKCLSFQSDYIHMEYMVLWH